MFAACITYHNPEIQMLRLQQINRLGLNLEFENSFAVTMLAIRDFAHLVLIGKPHRLELVRIPYDLIWCGVRVLLELCEGNVRRLTTLLEYLHFRFVKLCLWVLHDFDLVSIDHCLDVLIVAILHILRLDVNLILWKDGRGRAFSLVLAGSVVGSRKPAGTAELVSEGILHRLVVFVGGVIIVIRIFARQLTSEGQELVCAMLTCKNEDCAMVCAVDVHGGVDLQQKSANLATCGAR